MPTAARAPGAVGAGRRRQGAEDLELPLDRPAPDQPADRPGEGGDEGAEHGDVEGDVEEGGEDRAAEPAGAVAQEPVLRRLRVPDRAVQPVDHVGGGVAGAVAGARQRPRRRRVVATRNGREPARPVHHSRPLQLIERAEGERGGTDAAAGAAHAEVGRMRQRVHRDRLVRPRDRFRRLVAPGEGEQAHGGDAEQAETVGEHLQPGERRHHRRPGQVVRIGVTAIVVAEEEPTSPRSRRRRAPR